MDLTIQILKFLSTSHPLVSSTSFSEFNTWVLTYSHLNKTNKLTNNWNLKHYLCLNKTNKLTHNLQFFLKIVISTSSSSYGWKNYYEEDLDIIRKRFLFLFFAYLWHFLQLKNLLLTNSGISSWFWVITYTSSYIQKGYFIKQEKMWKKKNTNQS